MAGNLENASVAALGAESAPWLRDVWTVPATVLGGQITPCVSRALDTGVLKRGMDVLNASITTSLFIMAAGGVR